MMIDGKSRGKLKSSLGASVCIVDRCCERFDKNELER